MFFITCALVGVIAFVLVLFLVSIKDAHEEEMTYQNKLKDVYENIHDGEAKVVTLDFNAFKSVFELNPDDWNLRIYGISFAYFSRYVSSRDRYYILLKTKKDQKEAKKLYDDYHDEKERLIKSKVEMKDFESFKQLVQQDIDQKKKDANNELSKAKESLEKTLTNMR